MSVLQLLLRFRLRTLLVAIALVACFLAWRRHDPERAAVAAIGKAGGRVHYVDQMPSIKTTWFSVAMLPQFRYYSQVHVSHFQEFVPPKDWKAIVFGSGQQRHVMVVELQLEAVTPEMIEHLKSLSQLSLLIVDMPYGMLHEDSEEVQTLDALSREFEEMVQPAFNRQLGANP